MFPGIEQAAVGSLSKSSLHKTNRYQHDINIVIALQESGEWACPSSSSKLHSLHENGAVATTPDPPGGQGGTAKCQAIFRIQSKPLLSTLIRISLRPLDKYFRRCGTPLFAIESKFVIITTPGFLANVTPRFGLSLNANSPVPVKGPEARGHARASELTRPHSLITQADLMNDGQVTRRSLRLAEEGQSRNLPIYFPINLST